VGGFEALALARAEPTVKYHPYFIKILTSYCETSGGTVAGGQFDWGGSPLKSNEGAQRLAQDGRQSSVECISTSQLNCEEDTPSRYESRVK